MQHTKKLVLVSPETLSTVKDKIQQDKPTSSMKNKLDKVRSRTQTNIRKARFVAL